MKSPLVSILIRSTDPQTLQKTLQSVAAQRYEAIEVWVVAATPLHQSLPSYIGRFPLQLATTAVRLGRAQAANKALQLACGEMVLFLDDDDWIDPSHIDNLVEALLVNREYKAAYTQTKTVNDLGQDLNRPLIGRPYDQHQLLSGNFIAIHSVLFDVTLRALGCRFDENLDLFEDWDFWLQVSRHSGFLYLPQATAIYRIHDSSGVHQQVRFVDPGYQAIYRKWRDLWTEEQLSVIMTRNWEFLDNLKALSQTQSALNDAQGELNASKNSLKKMQTLLSTMTHELASTTADLRQSKEDLNKLQRVTQSLQNTLDSVMGSRSWRWTQKLRAVGRLARQVRQLVRQQGGGANAIKRSTEVLMTQGPQALVSAIQRATAQSFTYAEWINQNETPADQFEALKEILASWKHQPLVSVLMPTYNSPLNFLALAIESVQSQVYSNWQLCIADDASSDKSVQAFLKDVAAKDSRISIVLREKNGHISESSNSALSVAKGEWVALLDHDDLLHPLALYELVSALQLRPQANIVFSDEDKVDAQGVRFGPYFKCEYNPELMWAQNMISHLGCYRKSVLEQIGGFRKGFEGSQDYDLALRVIQLSQTSQIVHIPKVLYHWRAIVGSTALAPSEKPYAEIASRKALKEHLAHIGLAGTVTESPEVSSMNRVRLQLIDASPLVSILIPTKDRIDLLSQCIESIQKKSSYKHYEILVINNNSELPESFEYFDQLKATGVKVLDYPRPFNFSAINNFAAQQALGDYLCLLNNDIEVQTTDWLEEMLSFAQLPNVGPVGARLWYPGSSGLQHAGVVVGLGGVAGHSFVGLTKAEKGYFGLPVLHHRCSAVTAACLMIKKSTYLSVDGMDEDIAVAFNDVDFCLRLGEAGYYSVYTPHAEMTHHESASRGDDMSDANRARFMREEAFMKMRWGDKLKSDPFYSPNLSLDHSDYRISFQRRVV